MHLLHGNTQCSGHDGRSVPSGDDVALMWVTESKNLVELAAACI